MRGIGHRTYCRRPTGTGNLLVDILKTSSNRREKTLTVFNNILSEIECKIRRRLAEGGTSMEFAFPLVKPGLPTYDTKGCMEYVTRKLHSRGLDTLHTGPSTIAVTWDRLLRAADRQRVQDSILRHSKERQTRRHREDEGRKTKGPVKDRSDAPPVPPGADDPDDLFSLPSVQHVRNLAKVLRDV